MSEDSQEYMLSKAPIIHAEWRTEDDSTLAVTDNPVCDHLLLTLVDRSGPVPICRPLAHFHTAADAGIAAKFIDRLLGK